MTEARPAKRYSNHDLREAVRATGSAYLSVDDRPEALAAVAGVAERLGVATATVPLKADRYALAAALSALVIDAVVVGEDKRARFAQLLSSGTTRSDLDPYDSFALDLQATIGASQRRLLNDDSPHRGRVEWLVGAYENLLRIDPSARETSSPADTGMIFRGTELPFEIAHFVSCVSYACCRHPVLANLSAEQILGVARELSGELIGRASVNVAIARQRLFHKVDFDRVSIVLGQHGGTTFDRYVLDSDGQFSNKPVTGGEKGAFPTIRCPAHLGVESGALNTSPLRRAIHAGLNAALHHGLFDIELAEVAWRRRAEQGWKLTSVDPWPSGLS